MEPMQEDAKLRIQESMPESEQSASVAPSSQDGSTSTGASLIENVTEKVTQLFRRFTRWLRRNPRKAAVWGGVIILFVISFLEPLRVPPPHVALSGEPLIISDTLPSWFTSWFTNTILTTIVVDIIIVILALMATRKMEVVPKRWQSFVEMVLEYLYGLSESVSGRLADKFLPWVVTIFVFVIVSNWYGLLPGVGSIVIHQTPPADQSAEHVLAYSNRLAMADGKLILAPSRAAAEGEYGKEVPLFRAPSADLNTTFALAIVTMIMVQFWGIQALGRGYFRKFFQWNGPNTGMKLISAFVGVLELISEFSRMIAFGFRLFGNVFAGEIVLATMAFLIAYLVAVPFYIMEVFIGFVQALVFMMLALVFFTMATMGHEHDH